VTKKVKRRAPTRSKSAISPTMIVSVIAAALLIVGGLIVLSNQGQGGSSSVDISQFPALGDPNAPVTIIEFSDFG